jgi:nucleotide-binding universal stress UspA family protein
LRYAAAVAQREAGRLIVIFAHDPLLAAAASLAYNERKLAETTRVELRRFIASAVGAPAADAVDDLVVVGDPAREIAKAVRRSGCDLVVMGTRGLGGAGKLFFGSTTDRVLRTANFPVLAVPPGTNRRSKPPKAWPGSVLAAIEPGQRATANALEAADVARDLEARLLLVTVVPRLQTPVWLRRHGRAHDGRRVLAARAKLRALAATLGHPAVSVRVLTGDPADQISSAAADAGVGLIVLSLRSETRLLGARQGTVTYRVLCRATMPVLALAEHQRGEQS